MAMVPLVAKEDFRRAGHHTRRDQLPDFYMNDFTRLGLRVDPCDTAVRVLEANRYGLLRNRDGLHLTLEGADQMRTVVALLQGSGVSCEILDVAEAIYQG
jgi:hypothetical protein